jgi:selenocysteine lyase/cysteine desulfurase
VINQGLEKIRQHESCLVGQLIDGLRDDARFHLYGTLDREQRVATLALNVSGYTAAEAAGILDEAFQIAVRPGLHCAPYVHSDLGLFPEGAIRISVGYFNTSGDIDRCVAALKEIAA